LVRIAGKDCSKGGKGHGEGVGTDVKGGRSRRVRVMRKRRREKEIREGRGVTGEKIGGNQVRARLQAVPFPYAFVGGAGCRTQKSSPGAESQERTGP
jgi:hypothetical protein